VLTYRELKPPPALHRFVSCFWLLEEGVPPGLTLPQPILPDGSPELIFHLGDPSEASPDGGPFRRQPPAHLVGQITRPFLLRPAPGFRILGVRLRPAGAASLLEEPMDRLTGTWASLEDLLGKRGRVLSSEVRSASSIEEAIDRITAAWMRGSREVDTRVSHAVERLVESAGCLRIETLSREVGLGTRQLERGFLREVGVSPKFLARVLRFQRVFRAREERPDNWTRVAVRCGYYDAAHLVRDFHELAGEAPTHLVRSMGDITLSFASGNTTSDFSKTHYPAADILG